jgi:hypothetical protein
LIPAAAAAAVFGAAYYVFWILPGSGDARTEIFPFFYLTYLGDRNRLLGFCLDAAWLLVPALVVLKGRPNDPEWRSLPYLLLAVGPFIVVNVMHPVGVHTGIGADDDWGQIMLPVPLLAHAFVLSLAGQRWADIGGTIRASFLVLLALAVLPPALAAERYSRRLIVEPELGHEFVDNRSLAEALAVIPTNGTVIVTNDLRYPADGFRRGNRQMQIPALFGHQAFAVNYAYEWYSFSEERQDLQKLLSTKTWSDAIIQAAREHRWTHLIIRKDYVHPAAIPLELIFENGAYLVFRFKTT